jgi:AmiR/NasT family two-component response regulator
MLTLVPAMPGSRLSPSTGLTAGALRAPVLGWLLVTAGDTAEQLADARSDLAAATADTEHLQRALVSNRQIGMAMGILMERHRLTQEQAFERLRELSMRSNVKLRDVAEQIIYTGDTQPYPN